MPGRAKKYTARKLQEEIRRRVDITPTIAQMTEPLKQLFGVTGRVTGSTEVMLDVDQLELLASTLQAIISQGSNPPPRGNEKAASDPSHSRGGKGRSKAPAMLQAQRDPNVVAQLMVLRSRDQQLALPVEKGGYAGPTADQIVQVGSFKVGWPDPFDDLLEDYDRFRMERGRVIPTEKPNLVVVDRDTFINMRDGNYRWRWRSRQLYNRVERLVLSMWVDRPICKECQEEILDDFVQDAKGVLTWSNGLDRLRPPSRHDSCYGLAHVLLGLDIRLTGMDGDDPSTVALRSAAYQDAVRDAAAFLESKEIEPDIERLIKRFKIIRKLRMKGEARA